MFCCFGRPDKTTSLSGLGAHAARVRQSPHDRRRSPKNLRRIPARIWG
jgi:hypothetical protein